MKIAFIYDRVNKWGGAERLLCVLHDIFPDAPLYTSVYNPQSSAWSKVFKVIPSFLNIIKPLRTRHELLAPILPYVFANLKFKQSYDVIISITSSDAKFIKVPKNTLHINYLLTPTRYLWSHTHSHVGRGFQKILRLPIFSFLRCLDFAVMQKIPVIATISQTVAKRTLKYYRRQSSIIYPPYSLPNVIPNPQTLVPSPYFLVVSRLVPYKNIDLVMKAFNQLPDYNLVIVGQGSEYQKLQRLSQKNTTFYQVLHDEMLPTLYAQATALICPQIEDFGLVALEAHSFGLPVITNSRGGVAEIVQDGITGVHVNKMDVSNLITAIKNFDPKRYNHDNIIKRADHFSEARFKLTFKKFVEESWQNYQKSKY